MFRKMIAIAAFALIPLLGACDLDSTGPDFSGLGSAMGQSFCWDMSHGCS